MRPEWRPESYGYELWGCRIRLEFPTIKLLDYKAQWAELEQSRNPFAVLVMAHLHTLATRRKPAERYELKWGLIKRLYERGYTRVEIQSLFHFIDWLMILPPELSYKFSERLSEYEEEQKMPYITSVERIGIEKGLQQGLQQGVEQGMLQKAQEDILEVLNVRFGEVPQELSKAISNLTDASILKALHRQAITIESLDKFEQVLESLVADAPSPAQASPDLDD